MVRVTIGRRNGLVRSIHSTGHALRGPSGVSAPCAAVSVVLKGLAETLLHREDVHLDGRASRPGEFWLEVTDREPLHPGSDEWIEAAFLVAQRAIGEIARMWPDDVHVVDNDTIAGEGAGHGS